MTRTATLVSHTDREGVDREPGMALGDAACYYLSEPLALGGSYYADTHETRTTRYVWVSTAQVLGDWETYAFPSYRNGKVHSWRELSGSAKYELSHTSILEAMGYEVAHGAGRKPKSRKVCK